MNKPGRAFLRNQHFSSPPLRTRAQARVHLQSAPLKAYALNGRIFAGGNQFVYISPDGKLHGAGFTDADLSVIESWEDMDSVAISISHVLGLTKRGTVLALPSSSTYEAVCDVEGYAGVKSVAVGDTHTALIFNDGYVAMLGYEYSYPVFKTVYTGHLSKCAISLWHSAWLTTEGEIVGTGVNSYNQLDCDFWEEEFVDVACGDNYTVGLTKDSRVFAVGSNKEGQTNTEHWTDVVDIAAGSVHTVGLRSDGTVVARGSNRQKQCDVGSWTDIVDVACGKYFTVGVQKDGTVLFTGFIPNFNVPCGEYSWD